MKWDFVKWGNTRFTGAFGLSLDKTALSGGGVALYNVSFKAPT